MQWRAAALCNCRQLRQLALHQHQHQHQRGARSFSVGSARWQKQQQSKQHRHSQSSTATSTHHHHHHQRRFMRPLPQHAPLNDAIRQAAVREGLQGSAAAGAVPAATPAAAVPSPSLSTSTSNTAVDGGSVSGSGSGDQRRLGRLMNRIFSYFNRNGIVGDTTMTSSSSSSASALAHAAPASAPVSGDGDVAPATTAAAAVDIAQQLQQQQQPPASALSVEDVEEEDIRRAEEAIGSIDADHRLIELSPEPTPAEARLRQQKLAYIAELDIPGMTTNFKDHWDARMLGRGMRANHLLLGYFTVINPNLALCKWQGKVIAIRSAQAMNRALDRDQVAVHLLPIRHWTLGIAGPTVEAELKRSPALLTGLLEKSGISNSPVDIDSPFLSQEHIHALSQAGLVMAGEVVRVVTSFNNKCFTGSLTIQRNGKVAIFKPRDSRRVPSMLVPVHPLFMGLEVKRQLHHNLAKGISEAYTVAVKLIDWPSHLPMPVGEVLPLDTDLASIEGATRVLLVEAGIEERPFSPAALADVPNKFYISQQDRQAREDFTDRCVVSIDPATARDLDDALHVKSNGDGTFEVGVHIADVSHFVAPETALDREARRRSTSVYLVQRVIPMLPETLSNGYCSLHPGEEKLAFSIIFQLDKKCNVESYRFTKSIIKSCCRLSYEEAEQLLERADTSPSVMKPFTVHQVRTCVRQLHNFANMFRRKRIGSGAFGFSVAKRLQFSTEDASGVPQLMKEEEAETSHQLVEEWMLKANVAAAETLVAGAPELALLRRHPPPKDPQAIVSTLVSLSQLSGAATTEANAAAGAAAKLLSSSSGQAGAKKTKATTQQQQLQQIMLSLNQFLSAQSDVNYRSYAAALAIMQMSLAEYICTGYHTEPAEWRHFALQFPVYTHFTSPIRRYADLMVHRQLAKLLQLEQPHQQCGDEAGQQQPEQVEAQAMWCNRWRISAKRTSERSTQLFYAAFLRAAGPTEEVGYVRSISRQAIEVMTPQLMHSTRLEVAKLHQQLPGLRCTYSSSASKASGGKKRMAGGRPGTAAYELLFPPTEACPHRLRSRVQFGSALPVVLEAQADNLLTIGMRLRRPDCPKCAAAAAATATATGADDDDGASLTTQPVGTTTTAKATSTSAKQFDVVVEDADGADASNDDNDGDDNDGDGGSSSGSGGEDGDSDGEVSKAVAAAVSAASAAATAAAAAAAAANTASEAAAAATAAAAAASASAAGRSSGGKSRGSNK